MYFYYVKNPGRAANFIGRTRAQICLATPLSLRLRFPSVHFSSSVHDLGFHSFWRLVLEEITIQKRSHLSHGHT